MSFQQAPPRASLRSRRPWVAVGAAALAVPLIFASAPAAYGASPAPADAIAAIEAENYLPDFQHEYLEQVNSTNIWNNDVKLSHEIGPRLRGTPAEYEAIEWVAEQFASFGLETEIEEFPITAQLYADITPSRYTDEYASWQFRPAGNGRLTGPENPVAGDVVDIGATTTGIANRTDLAGKVVLADWNNTSSVRTALLTDLKAAGVAAVVLTKVDGISSPEALPNPGNLAASLTDMVVVGAANNQGKRIRALLEGGPLSLSIMTNRGAPASHNAIGVIPAANGDEDAPIVYLGAHIDSVLGSPGASDNGSGVSILLEIARIMGQYDYDVEVRFGAWGSEESGYHGSNYHVKTVMSAEEQARTIGAWNMDMAGTNYPGNEGQPFGFWALTADTNRLPLSPDENNVLGFADTVSQITGNGNLNIGTVSRSDHQPFHDVGIHAVVFSWMFWAGGTNIILEPAYHQTTDTLEFVSEERMAYAGEVLGGSAFRASLNEVFVSVTDEHGEPAAGATVAMSCEGDEGWREVGETDDDGLAESLAPHINCDFAALAENGARGSAIDEAIVGPTGISIELQADTEAPEVIISASPAAAETGWHQTVPVTVDITATDNLAEAPAIEYSLDGSTWATYEGSLTFDEQGEHLVFARATDDFGNTSEVVSYAVLIDSVKPALSVAADSGKRGQVTATAYDATSGIAAVQYRIGTSGEWLPFESEEDAAPAAFAALAANSTTSITANLPIGNAAAEVQFRAFDSAGNVSSTTSLMIAATGGGGLSVTGAEAGSFAAIAAAVLLLAAGGSLLIVRRRRANDQLGSES